MIARVRDGLLHDNKVVTAVLGVLALLIFAWIVAGALIGGTGDEEQQASNQASLAQGGDSESGETETPAPGVENRDSDASYGGFDEGPKDPFRQLIPKAGEEGGGQDNEDNDDRESGGSGGSRSGSSQDGETGRRGSSGDSGDSDEDFIEQRSPGGSGSRNVPGGGGGQGSANQGGVGKAGGGQNSAGQGDAGQAGGSGGLFNSGGDLPAP